MEEIRNQAHATSPLSNLFNLPVLVQAFNQLQELQLELSVLLLNTSNDSWTYIWGTPQFSSSMEFKLMTGHAQVHVVFKWLWKTSCQCKYKVFFWLVLKDRLSTKNIIQKEMNALLHDYNCVL
jgi:hypothetical protein